jgi:hypothetical protein
MSGNTCAICIGEMRTAPYVPLVLGCNCKPVFHKQCWQKWLAYSGQPRCIICRWPEDRTNDVAQLPINPEPRDRMIMHTIFILLVVYFVLYCIRFVDFYAGGVDLSEPAEHDEL